MGNTRRKARNPILLFVMVLLAASMFAGCTAKKAAEVVTGTPAPASTAAATAAPANDPYKDHMDISIAYWAIGDALPDGAKDPVADLISKKFNVTLKPMNVTWDDYTQKIQVWAASGQLPDLFSIDAAYSPNFKKWASQGVIHALPSDLSAYPTLAKIMNLPDNQGYKYPLGDANGKFFSIPRPNFHDANWNAIDNGVLIRKDWMQNVGITKAPETMDEFITLMKAFAEKDPDKNGKNDTVGLTAFDPSWLTYMMEAYEPGLMMSGVPTWIRSNGQWLPAFMSDKAAAGLKAMKQLYDAGGLDKDFATLKATEGMDKFASGQAGAYAHDVTPGVLLQVKTKYEQLHPGKKFEDAFMILPPLKNTDGNYYRDYVNANWSESYINAKADDKKVDRILRMYDFFLTEEGYNLLHYGIEGVDYKKDGSNIVLIDQKGDDGKPVVLNVKYPFLKAMSFAEWGGSATFTDPTIPETLRKMSKDNLDWLLQNAKPVDTDLRLNFIDYPSKAKATENVANDMVKVILSKDAEKTWKDMVSGYKANGYDQIVKEFNAKTKELGINP